MTMFWEVIKMLCNIPLGIAAICGCVILGMVAFIICSLICYCFWCFVFAKQEPSIFGRKWEDGDL